MDSYEAGRELGGIINDLVKTGVSVPVGLFRVGRRLHRKAKARQAEQRARSEAEAQRREWRELVERQKVRGEAGNASYEEAAEALRGAGGRPNPLDQRKF
jgi:Outer membrane efflux protein